MCGQWGVEGYLRPDRVKANPLPPETWKRLADEVAAHGVPWVGFRGGEPFLYPGFLDVLSHAKARGLSISIDTNGTLLDRHAEELARIGVDNLNLSVDGPEPIHDAVRGVPGGFARIRNGAAAVQEAYRKRGRESPIKAIVFTISPDSYRGLGAMPDVARALGVPGIAIVPYYYFDEATGRAYEKVMKEELGSDAGSWKGFHREASGVDGDELASQLRQFNESLGDVHSIPFMRYSERDYREWFGNCISPVGKLSCQNPWRLLDIQPNGDANFCVDFPDYVIGNIADQTLEAVWNSPRAEKFRAYLKTARLPICNRCGAKYMSGSEPDA